MLWEVCLSDLGSLVKLRQPILSLYDDAVIPLLSTLPISLPEKIYIHIISFFVLSPFVCNLRCLPLHPHNTWRVS